MKNLIITLFILISLVIPAHARIRGIIGGAIDSTPNPVLPIGFSGVGGQWLAVSTDNILYGSVGSTIRKNVTGDGILWSVQTNISPVNKGLLWVSSNKLVGQKDGPVGEFIYKTIDAGINWTLAFSVGSSNSTTSSGHNFFNNPSDGRLWAYLSDSSARIFFSDNAGDNWSEGGVLGVMCPQIGGVAAIDTNILVVGSSGSPTCSSIPVRYSSNNGVSFVGATPESDGQQRCEVLPLNGIQKNYASVVVFENKFYMSCFPISGSAGNISLLSSPSTVSFFSWISVIGLPGNPAGIGANDWPRLGVLNIGGNETLFISLFGIVYRLNSAKTAWIQVLNTGEGGSPGNFVQSKSDLYIGYASGNVYRIH